MGEDTFVIKIKDGEPLIVPKNILTADSLMFRRLVNELRYEEHDITDFSPEAVTMFLAVLADRDLGDQINDDMFRELHKLSVVFEVDWLREDCCTWLKQRMNSATDAEEKTFLFEECWYIFDKWGDSGRVLIEVLISKLAPEDNSSFVSNKISDVERLEILQIDFMLKVGGSNADLFLQAILQNLIGQKRLNEKLKYLIENMNLALCCELNEEVYLQVFDTLSDLSEMNVADLRYVHKTTSETTRMVSYRRDCRANRKHDTASTVVYDINYHSKQRKGCKELTDIIKGVSENGVTSMFEVVELLLYVFYKHEPNRDDGQIFLTSLENVCSEKRLQKISHQYLDFNMTALKFSNLEQSDQIISMLGEIRRNKKLTTSHENVIITRDDVIIVKNGVKDLYIFKHPGTANCKASGECGFILRNERQDGKSKLKLLTNEEEYTDTDIHYHDIVTARDMFSYVTQSGRTVEGDTITVAERYKWRERWLPGITDWKLEARYVAYDVSDYLVAKRH